jgi:ketosteroid isomerase-like protein
VTRRTPSWRRHRTRPGQLAPWRTRPVQRCHSGGVSPNVDIVRRAFAAFELRDAEALVAVCSPDVVFEPVTARLIAGGEPYRGHAGMRRYLADVARVWRELRPMPDTFHEGPDGLVLVTGRVTAWGLGRVIDAPAGWLWRLNGGLIAHGRVFETATEAIEASGLGS